MDTGSMDTGSMDTGSTHEQEVIRMLMRFDPFAELDRLAQPARSGRPAVMAMDAYRHGDSFVIRFDLPGVDPAGVDLTVEKNVLTVRAERNWRPEEGDDVLARERPQGSFTRQLFLGEGLDPDRIEAHYEHGVLSVTIPVAEKAKPRRVTVNTTSGGPAAVDAGSGPVEATSRQGRAA